MKFIRSQSLRWVQAFEKFGFPYNRNNNIIHERSRPISERALAMLIFVEHIRKLTIKFTCLFQFRFSNIVTISPLKGWYTLSVFLLTIYASIQISMSPTKLLTYKSCCILTSAFISLPKVSKFLT